MRKNPGWPIWAVHFCPKILLFCDNLYPREWHYNQKCNKWGQFGWFLWFNHALRGANFLHDIKLTVIRNIGIHRIIAAIHRITVIRCIACIWRLNYFDWIDKMDRIFVTRRTTDKLPRNHDEWCHINWNALPGAQSDRNNDERKEKIDRVENSYGALMRLLGGPTVKRKNTWTWWYHSANEDRRFHRP